MARGCSESDSEEERHDRFRSERNNSSLTASKSLYSTGLQQSIKSRSPLRRLNSPSRRDRRSRSKRSRSRSKRRSKERKKSKDRRGSKEKSKKDLDKSCRRSSSKNKESKRNDSVDSVKLESSRRRSRSKGSRRSGSKEKKKKRENKRSYSDDQTDDTFLQRFERRRPSVENENEMIESTFVYRDSSSEPEPRVTSKSSHGSKSHKKEKKIKKTHGDAEEGELISEEENNCFGPALPPARIESEEEDGEVKDNVIAEGPALPPGFNKRIIGPALPERYHSRRRSISQEEQHTKCQRTNKSDSDEDRKCERTNLIGPSLPPTESLTSVNNPEDDKEETLYGPALPPQPATCQGFEDSLIGPLPQGMELDDRVQRILEERAQSLKKQMENKDSDGNSDQKGRESWMLELPDLKTAASIGLGPRKFKTKEGPDMSDRSSWTDTPGSKKNKQENTTDIVEDSRRLEIAARNEEMELKAKKASSHREKSLLELHQKELKKKKKKELESSGGKVERRPFSREIDLQTHKFDEAQKRSIISKAQLLDTRFSSANMERDGPLKIARRSSIWLYFSKDHKRDLAQCIICGTMLSIKGGSSSNLSRHLRAKHKKIKVPKGRSIIKDTDIKQQDNVENIQNGEQNMLVLENFDGETLPAEIIIREGSKVEIKMEDKKESINEDKVTIWEEIEPVETVVTTTASPPRETTSQKCIQRNESDDRVTDLKKKVLLKRKSDQYSSEKVEALMLIAHNLGRMATSFEIIADCFRKYQQNQKNHSNTEIISKLNDIVQILKRNDTQNDQPSTNDIVSELNKNVSPILRTLNLLPKFKKMPKIIKKCSK